jgi:hypothetical protein
MVAIASALMPVASHLPLENTDVIFVSSLPDAERHAIERPIKEHLR